MVLDGGAFFTPFVALLEGQSCVLQKQRVDDFWILLARRGLFFAALS
jgi:hypothetical protein